MNTKRSITFLCTKEQTVSLFLLNNPYFESAGLASLTHETAKWARGATNNKAVTPQNGARKGIKRRLLLTKVF
jgi:hypothetical protein